MVIELNDVLQAPATTCRDLEGVCFGIQVEAINARATRVVIDIRFAPIPELATAGYGLERGRVVVRATGRIYAFPLGPQRLWKHREGSPLGSRFGHLGGELCLYYPRDPRALRWEWDDGLEGYITRVHRHLFLEEYWRRNGTWFGEDVPHGEPATGRHPITSAFMRREAGRWAA